MCKSSGAYLLHSGQLSWPAFKATQRFFFSRSRNSWSINGMSEKQTFFFMVFQNVHKTRRLTATNKGRWFLFTLLPSPLWPLLLLSGSERLSTALDCSGITAPAFPMEQNHFLLRFWFGGALYSPQITERSGGANALPDRPFGTQISSLYFLHWENMLITQVFKRYILCSK